MNNSQSMKQTLVRNHKLLQYLLPIIFLSITGASVAMKGHGTAQVLLPVCAVVAIAVLLFFYFRYKIIATADGNTLTIKGFTKTVTVSLSDIESLKIERDILCRAFDIKKLKIQVPGTTHVVYTPDFKVADFERFFQGSQPAAPALQNG